MVGLRVAVAVVLAVVLAGCAATAAGVEERPPASSASSRLLQMNLCNSGIADCYAGGRSVDEAAAVLRSEAPDLVTLNEVCEGDVEVLAQTLDEAHPGGQVASAFRAARDRDTGEAYRCRNGQEFGNGVLSRGRSGPVTDGVFPAQDPEDPEERSWVCLAGVCTTHLAYTDRSVTIEQCRYLFGTVVAGLRARGPVVLGGDLNLGSDDGADLASCLPVDHPTVDDGDVQVVAATPEITLADIRLVDLNGASDHPGLLVTLVMRRP